ncbi:MAG: type III pantothenate kinase [Nannocystaceae bacterium]
MLLAVDVGNSNTSLGVFDGENLRCQLSTCTRREWTRDQLAAEFVGLLRLVDLRFDDLDEAVIACVVPPSLRPLCEALETYAGITPLTLGPGVKTGMPVRCDPPQDVGTDRIVAAVAAHALHRLPDGPAHGMVVVDFGTATTFDVVSPRPEYLGGVIAPGVGISADALFSRAAKLPRVEVTRPKRVVGTTTVGALHSGLVYGYVGLVEGIVRRIRDEVAWPVRVVGTGGFAHRVVEDSDVIDVHDPTLMLHGLQLIYKRNAAS